MRLNRDKNYQNTDKIAKRSNCTVYTFQTQMFLFKQICNGAFMAIYQQIFWKPMARAKELYDRHELVFTIDFKHKKNKVINFKVVTIIIIL